ncbi:type IV pilus assembly protein PilN [Marinospirillum celere]|uniref:Type IV pilus assembly protein PilN n=1 Tax=Marinospirillum celere TaxID=1122252 RepID=A0A1I1IPR0_9GAMM|nr:PilN domain-containing protein [Marinospirillum celere]SFC37682.1 type IV pilus assembly protein PilN [Marinospirillum celere]
MSDGINLRPWREERRQFKQTQFVYLAVATLLLGLLLSAFWWWSGNQSIHAVQEENQQIREQLSLLDAEIREVTELRTKREQLLQRIEVIQSLQQERPVTIDLLDQLTGSLTDGIYLTDVRRQSNQITIQGHATPSQALSDWMRKLSKQQRFREPVLRSVTSDESIGASRFDLLLPLAEDR